MNTIQSIVEWFKIAKPNPSNQDLIKQIAFHCEEFAEMLDAIYCDIVSEKVKELKEVLMGISDDKERSDNFVSSINRVGLLDALCDQTVTATGVATFAGMDFEPALEEVDNSNWTKFALDEKGNPVPYIRPDGKIGKNPETYKEPQLELFLNRNED